MLTKADAAQRVARGAAHLDQVRPGWAQRIDVGTLTLHDPCGCIVGQLCGLGSYGWRAYGTPFSRAVMSLKIRDAVAYGFELDDDDCDPEVGRRPMYPVLQDAWVDAIAARLHPEARLDPVEALAPEEENTCVK